MKQFLSLVLFAATVTMFGGCAGGDDKSESLARHDRTETVDGERYLDPIYKVQLDVDDAPYSENFSILSLKDDSEKLTIYAPENDKETKRPVVFVVGGGDLASVSYECVHKMGVYLTKCGYVVVLPRYQCTPEDDSPKKEIAIKNAVVSLDEAISWVKFKHEKFGIDTASAFLFGYSDGAEIVSNLYYSDLFDCSVNKNNIKGVVAVSTTLRDDIPDLSKNAKAKCLIVGNKQSSTYFNSLKLNERLGSLSDTCFFDNKGKTDFFDGYDADLVKNVVVFFYDKIDKKDK